jgi:hypothetical protein
VTEWMCVNLNGDCFLRAAVEILRGRLERQRNGSKLKFRQWVCYQWKQNGYAVVADQ